ncbi:hypothetical protein ACI65C_003608 [Semiaphis heraclei]
MFKGFIYELIKIKLKNFYVGYKGFIKNSNMFSYYVQNYIERFLISHVDTAYREIKRLFPLEWKRAFFVGKKFVGYSMFDNNYGKMRKNSKTEPKIDNYEDTMFINKQYSVKQYNIFYELLI